MTSFTFVNANSTNFSTSTFYLVVVEATPLSSYTLRSQLTEVSGQPISELTGKTVTAGNMTFNDFTIAAFTYPNTILGTVICRQLGGSPSTTDEPVAYISFTNGLGEDIVILAGLASIPMDFGVNGAIQIIDVYRYSSGAYINPGNANPYNGLINLIGTANGATSFSNPANGSIFDCLYYSNTNAGLATTHLTDRSLANGPTQLSQTLMSFAFDFKVNRIRVGGLASKINLTGGSFQLFGSNNISAGFNQNGVTGTADWTSLVAFSSGGAPWNASNVSDTTYWRYLKLSVSSAAVFQELEFYNSTIQLLSPL